MTHPKNAFFTAIVFLLVLVASVHTGFTAEPDPNFDEPYLTYLGIENFVDSFDAPDRDLAWQSLAINPVSTIHFETGSVLMETGEFQAGEGNRAIGIVSRMEFDQNSYAIEMEYSVADNNSDSCVSVSMGDVEINAVYCTIDTDAVTTTVLMAQGKSGGIQQQDLVFIPSGFAASENHILRLEYDVATAEVVATLDNLYVASLDTVDSLQQNTFQLVLAAPYEDTTYAPSVTAEVKRVSTNISGHSYLASLTPFVGTNGISYQSSPASPSTDWLRSDVGFTTISKSNTWVNANGTDDVNVFLIHDLEADLYLTVLTHFSEATIRSIAPPTITIDEFVPAFYQAQGIGSNYFVDTALPTPEEVSTNLVESIESLAPDKTSMGSIASQLEVAMQTDNAQKASAMVNAATQQIANNPPDGVDPSSLIDAIAGSLEFIYTTKGEDNDDIACLGEDLVELWDETELDWDAMSVVNMESTTGTSSIRNSIAGHLKKLDSASEENFQTRAYKVLYRSQVWLNSFVGALRRCDATYRLAELARFITINYFTENAKYESVPRPTSYKTWHMVKNGKYQFVSVLTRAQFLHLVSELINTIVNIDDWQKYRYLRDLVALAPEIFEHYSVWGIGGVSDGKHQYLEYPAYITVNLQCSNSISNLGSEYSDIKIPHNHRTHLAVMSEFRNNHYYVSNGSLQRRTAIPGYCGHFHDWELFILTGITELIAADNIHENVLPAINSKSELASIEQGYSSNAFFEYYNALTEYFTEKRLIDQPDGSLVWDMGGFGDHPYESLDSNDYSMYIPNLTIDRKQVYAGDYNGDGLDDLYIYMRDAAGNNLGFDVLCSNGYVGENFWDTFYPCASNNAGPASIKWTRIGDYNGDGSDDIWQYLPGNGWRVLCPNSNAGFNTCLSASKNGWGNGYESLVGNYNTPKNKAGTDLWQATRSGWRVLCSLGGNLKKCASSGKGIADINLVGDFNGDGHDDLWQADDSGYRYNGKTYTWRISRSPRKDISNNGTLTSTAYLNMGLNAVYKMGRDINGDKKVELVRLNGNYFEVLGNYNNHTLNRLRRIWYPASDRKNWLVGRFFSSSKLDILTLNNQVRVSGNICGDARYNSKPVFIRVKSASSSSKSYRSIWKKDNYTCAKPTRSLDTSHYRRMVRFVDTTYRNPILPALREFVEGNGATKVATWYLNLKKTKYGLPTFPNYIDGKNGWFKNQEESKNGDPTTTGTPPNSFNQETAFNAGWRIIVEYIEDTGTKNAFQNLTTTLDNVYARRTEDLYEARWRTFYGVPTYSKNRYKNELPDGYENLNRFRYLSSKAGEN